MIIIGVVGIFYHNGCIRHPMICAGRKYVNMGRDKHSKVQEVGNDKMVNKCRHSSTNNMSLPQYSICSYGMIFTKSCMKLYLDNNRTCHPESPQHRTIRT